MAKKKSTRKKPTARKKSTSTRARSKGEESIFAKRRSDGTSPASLHRYGAAKRLLCQTNSIGMETPGGRDPVELRFDATEGLVPVWGPNVTLRWRFNEASMQRYFESSEAAKAAIRNLFGEAVTSWGDASPVRFAENDDAWDFELTMKSQDDCDGNACTLARAFFPDGGRHDIAMYPKLFAQSREEIIETLVHELGHVFGLRHFFANVSEAKWPSVQFGSNSPFTIMNYGHHSVLTDADRLDLRTFYKRIWDSSLLEINGTPIVQFRPFHESIPDSNPRWAPMQNAVAHEPLCPCCCHRGGDAG